MIISFVKIFFIGLIIYLSVGFFIFQYIFIPLKEQIITNQNKVINNNIKLFETLIEKPLLHIEYAKINNLSEEFIVNNGIQELHFKLLEYYVTRENLLNNSSNIKEHDWILGDISIDNKFGEIKKVGDSIYQFIYNDEYNFNIPIKVKFQALNEEKMENSISTVNFKLPEYLITKKVIEDKIKRKLQNIWDLQDQSYEKTFLLPNNQPYASISFSYHQHKIVDRLYSFLEETFKTYTIGFTFIFFLYFIISYIFTRSLIFRHLTKLQEYIIDIENNKFYKYDASILKNKKLIKIAESLGILSKKMAAIINELNVNKDLLEQQVSIDNLTKLPNRKIFEADLKSLFITHVDSHIGKIKLVSLSELSSLNNQDAIDQYIQEFARIIEHSFQKFSNNFSTIYRIYGSEFVFIIKHSNYDQALDIFEDLDIEINEFKEKYSIEKHVFKGVAIPLHKYTSIKNIYEDLDQLYENSIEEEQSHYVLDNESISDEDEKLEKTIQSIIKNDAFTISTKFDTYSFDEEPELIMQEIAPNLIDTEGKEIPIGTFIGVAESLKIAIEFDKNVILKTFKYIRKNEIKHELAINVSISSICEDSFVTWLETQTLYDYKDLLPNVVFSITSFAANTNFEKFEEFTNRLARFNAKVILKRFSYNDLSMQELEQVHLNYIRIHKDYTNNIDHEREVIIRNIINFANLQNVKILGDIISNKHDYEIAKKLRFYGTSR